MMRRIVCLQFLAAGVVPSLIALACSSAKPGPVPSEMHDAATSGVPSAPAIPSTTQVALAPRGHVSPPGPMALIKGGVFKMGANAFGFDDADYLGPAHAVKVASFRMDITEVTVAAYRACVETGPCTTPVDTHPGREPYPLRCPWTFQNIDDYPISCVTWSQADAYCGWAKKMLPTEEMWEYAARGEAGRDFPWGWTVHGNDWGRPDDLDERIYGKNSCHARSLGFTPDDPKVWKDTCQVGGAPKGATPEGLLDMAGNVSEWTSTFSCSYKEPNCKTTLRAVRGYWASAARMNQSVYRLAREPDDFDIHVGFRCAQRLEGAKAH